MTPKITNVANTGAGTNSGNNNRVAKVSIWKEIMDYYTSKMGGKTWNKLTIPNPLSFDGINVGSKQLAWYLDYKNNTKLLLITNIDTNFEGGKKADVLVKVKMTNVTIDPPAFTAAFQENAFAVVAKLRKLNVVKNDYCILRSNTLSVKKIGTATGNAIERVLFHMVSLDLAGKNGIQRLDLPPASKYNVTFPKNVNHIKLTMVVLALDKKGMLTAFDSKLGV